MSHMLLVYKEPKDLFGEKNLSTRCLQSLGLKQFIRSHFAYSVMTSTVRLGEGFCLSPGS